MTNLESPASLIVDSSAVLAIVFQEPEAERLATAIANARDRSISAVNWLETMMVAESRFGPETAAEASLIFDELEIRILPADAQQMHEARAAWRRFGKGRHAAGLNLGDCCAYAAAMTEGLPLLFKGEDFGKTDVEAAAW